MLSFGTCQLDPVDERLWRDGCEVQLRRKPLAILTHLVRNPGRLVTHEELVEAVWGKIAMSESLLRTNIRTLRQVLDDGAIQTVVGRGYRFTLDVGRGDAGAPARPPSVPPPLREASLVGRAAQMDALREVLRSAESVERRVLFVDGEAGVGKTTLVRSFLDEAASRDRAWTAYGACVEHYGAGEAYLPVFAALERLCRRAESRGALAMLERHAPTWLVQMPALIDDARAEEIHRRTVGATQARMLRELADVLEVIAAERPLVVVLDDVQWADHSTIEALAMLARRAEQARLLILAAYRSGEVAKGHPLPRVTGELLAHKQAALLSLGGLTEGAVAEYVDARFSGHAFPSELAQAAFRTTNGNPLFLATVFDDLESRGMIGVAAGRWRLHATIDQVAAIRPESIRRLVDVQVDRLEPLEQRVLEVGSVAGSSFAAGIVAHVLGADVDHVEACCDSLSRARRILRHVGDEEWPDGSIQSRYEFAHALVRGAVLERVPAGSARQWHRRIAERLRAGHPESLEPIVTKLAEHLERGQELDGAIEAHALAGERAARRRGHHEAVEHFDRARALLARRPQSAERDAMELRVLGGLGPSSIVATGACDATMATIAAAAELAGRLGNNDARAAALVELQECRDLRGAVHELRAHAEETIAAARLAGAPALVENAELLATLPDFFRGRPLENAARHRALWDAAERRGEEPGAVQAKARALLAVDTWFLGRPDEAVAHAHAAESAAAALGDPATLTKVLIASATVAFWRRDPRAALGVGERIAAHLDARATQRDAERIGHWRLGGGFSLPWARAAVHPSEAPAIVDDALRARAWEALPTARTYQLLLLIEVARIAGRSSIASTLLREAMTVAAKEDEHFVEAELHRLRGELALEDSVAAAIPAFEAAIAVARQQSACSLELRAATSLARVSSGRKKTPAVAQLRKLVATFTEGFDTPDLVEASSLLERIS